MQVNTDEYGLNYTYTKTLL